MSQVTLEQWQALIAVVEHDGYAQAAEALNKSQSSVSYAIQKLETVLGISAFKIKGRKAELTPAGKMLYQRASILVSEAKEVEALASRFAVGWEAEIRIAMDTLFPEWLMLDVIEAFTESHPLTRISLHETVLSGTDEALLRKEADLVIGARVPPGFLGDPLMNVTFIAVASAAHPLHQLQHPITYDDLRQHRQLVIKDSGSRDMDAGWLGAQQRLTLSHIHTSINAACRGLGYAWYPELKIKKELLEGRLVPLPLATGGKRHISLNLTLAEGSFAGPACKAFAELLKEKVSQYITQ